MTFKFRNLSPIDWFGVLSPTVAVAVGALSLAATGQGGPSWTTLIGLVIVYLTGEKFARIAFEHQVRDNFVHAKRSANDLICLGSVEDGVLWFCDHSEGLERVENTVFTRGQNTHIIDELTWARHLAAIKRAIANNCIWTDLVAADQLEEVKKFAAGLSAAERQRYNLFKLDAKIPIIQCMTLCYSDGTVKVLYGWDYAAKTCKSDFVFLGEGQRLGNYFGNYMSALENQAERVNWVATAPPPPPAPARVVRQATEPPAQ